LTVKAVLAAHSQARNYEGDRRRAAPADPGTELHCGYPNRWTNVGESGEPHMLTSARACLKHHERVQIVAGSPKLFFNASCFGAKHSGRFYIAPR
jgi:hypothetical protein